MALQKRTQFILATSLIFLALLLVVFELICRSGEDCKCFPYSLSKDAALKDGLLINTYYAINKTVPIPGTTDNIILDSAWTEYAHSKKRWLGLCVFERDVIIKDSTSNTLSLPFEISPKSKPFTASFKIYSGNNGDKVFYQHTEERKDGRIDVPLTEFGDTIKIVLSNYDTLITNIADTILFIKRK